MFYQLERGWTLAPEDYGNHPRAVHGQALNFYLGYTIERACKQNKVVPRKSEETALSY